ncbi:twin transmembrane helix small protein [Roseomonas sp. AR75]|uniref:twin transmembrane helix small protein n=1 Tax=Roseomonas sp. AR75 TaxID=2562311 RepID=UPI0010BF8AC2|nr:twin transmembrane helix small protein [Roseomonas sp. AR75]
MVTVLKALVVVSMLATLGVMLAGMAGLVRSEHGGGARSNLLMRWRVGLQFLTIILFALLLLAMRG